jgi:hypothetical protein
MGGAAGYASYSARRRMLGTMPLPDANRLHRDIDLSGSRALELGFLVRAAGVRVPRIREVELRSIARRLRDEGQPIRAGCWLLGSA